MTKEQYAADVRNWLAELVIGAKAMMRTVRYEDGTYEYLHTTRCYTHEEVTNYGLAIHDLREICRVANIDYTFVPVKGYLEEHKVAGHWACWFNGVRFYDLAYEYDPEYKKWKKEHENEGK